MGDSESRPIRRQPPEWLRVEVSGSRTLAPWLTLVTLSGTPLTTMDTPGVAASVRLLIPGPDDDDLVIPSWSGNEFLLPSGERPLIRTFTPLRFDAGSGTLELAVVVHPSGSASDWVSSAHPGDRAAVSGPGRGWDPPPGLRQITLLGDASATAHFSYRPSARSWRRSEPTSTARSTSRCRRGHRSRSWRRPRT